MVEEIVSPFHATTVQRQLPAKATPIVTDSVAKPAVIQPGPEGIQIYEGIYGMRTHTLFILYRNEKQIMLSILIIAVEYD